MGMPGTEGVRGPFFSPDGSWIGFWAAGKLKKINVSGGSPVVLCDAPDLLGASWGENDQIIAAFGGPALLRISAAGGGATPILDLSQQSEIPMWPQVLRHGRVVLFTARGSSGPNQAHIESLSLDTGKRTLLIAGGSFGRVFANSYITYVNQGTLYALSFDQKSNETHGSPVPVLDGVWYSPIYGYADMDLSRTGDLVFRKRQTEVIAQWLGPSGKLDPMLSVPGSYFWPRLSPDGSRLAYSATESGESRVTIYQKGSNRFVPIPSEPGPCAPLWTPDARFLVLGCSDSLLWVPADGSGKPQVLLEGKVRRVP
jgi:WD40-like Beta Propeller Repeat